MARGARIAFGLNLAGLRRVRDAVAIEDSAAAADLRIAVKVELFFVVAFAGAVAEASGVVIGAGLMTAVLALALVAGTVKDAIDSPVA